MSISLPLPRLVTWWHHRPHHCLQCKQVLEDGLHGRWCSAECQDYWVQDSV